MKKIVFLLNMFIPMLLMAQNVGIGTTNPAAKLHIINTDNFNALNISNQGFAVGVSLVQSNTSSTSSALLIDNRGLGKSLYILSGNTISSDPAILVSNSSPSKAVYIQQNNAATSEPALYVSHAGSGNAIETPGYVQIGTGVAPVDAKLKVMSNSDFFAGTFQAHFNEQDNDYARIGFGNNNGTGWHLAAYSNSIPENERFNIYSANVGADVLSLTGHGDMTLRRSFRPGGSAGTAGQTLTSNGPNAAPTWQSPLLQAAFRVTTNTVLDVPQSPARLSVNFANIVVNDNLYWSSVFQAYVANNTGLYQFNVNLHFSLFFFPGTTGLFDNQVLIYINVNGVSVHTGTLTILPSQVYIPFLYDYNFSTLLPLNFNDQVSIQCTRDNGIPGGGSLGLSSSSFSGYRVK
jgi:hypothetical protein